MGRIPPSRDGGWRESVTTEVDENAAILIDGTQTIMTLTADEWTDSDAAGEFFAQQAGRYREQTGSADPQLFVDVWDSNGIAQEISVRSDQGEYVRYQIDEWENPNLVPRIAVLIAETYENPNYVMDRLELTEL